MGEAGLKKAFIQLHLSVLLAGFTGLFGKLITLNEATLVWYRLFFTTAILIIFTGFPKVSWRKFLQIAGCGTLLAYIGVCSTPPSRRATCPSESCASQAWDSSPPSSSR